MISQKHFILLVLIGAVFIVCGRAGKDQGDKRNESAVSDTVSKDQKVMAPEEIRGENSIQMLQDQAAASGNSDGTASGGSGISVYYFHPTARCETCLNIEAYSKEAVGSWQAASGESVTWRSLNIEEKENDQYIIRYDLKFSSLILSMAKGGKELRWKNLTQIWELANNKAEFVKYIKSELEQFAHQNQ